MNRMMESIPCPSARKDGLKDPGTVPWLLYMGELVVPTPHPKLPSSMDEMQPPSLANTSCDVYARDDNMSWRESESVCSVTSMLASNDWSALSVSACRIYSRNVVGVVGDSSGVCGCSTKIGVWHVDLFALAGMAVMGLLADLSGCDVLICPGVRRWFNAVTE